jgi:hypothetical protein
VNTTGSAVTSWNDLSGNGYNATQGTAGNRPAYSSTGSTTGKPEITFTRANSQYLQIASLASTFAPGTLSVFSVARFANSSSCTGCSYERIFDFGGGSASDNILIARSGATSNVDFSIYSSSTGGDRASSSSFSTNTFIFDVVTSSTTPNFYFNGTADNSASGSNQTAQSLARTINYIGRSNWSADAYLQGGVSELLFFKVNLNNTQRILVENYQAAQWGLLSSLSSLKYVPTSTTTYNTNLLGIGRQSSSDNVPSTLSGDGFSLSSTVGAGNFLQDDGDYLLAAHNGQASTTLTIGSGSSTITVWNRSWYLNKTDVNNNGGNVTLYFDFGAYNGTTPTGVWALLYRPNDGNFGSGVSNPVIKIGSIVGNKVLFTLDANNLINGYYTIGSPGPFPIITSINPVSGPISTSVTITGQNFNSTAANNIVFFGATQAAVTGATSTSLTVTVPYGANYQYISVTNLAYNTTGYSATPFVVTFPSNGVTDFAIDPVFSSTRRTTKRTIKKTIRRTIRRTAKRTIRRTAKRTIRRTTKKTIRRTIRNNKE